MSITSELYPALRDLIRGELYPGRATIGLHEPTFDGNERTYVLDAIDSTFVSSVGAYVDRFEALVADYTGAERAVATMNGTAALHMALQLVGVRSNDLVITQPLTFVATAAAIRYCGADPVFVDIETDTLGLSADAIAQFLRKKCTHGVDGAVLHRESGRRVAACVPMHTFGLPLRIEEIVETCGEFDIPIVEDAAESLGSFSGGRHTGTFGTVGVISFNGNKTITTGGGGMVITTDAQIGARAKHSTTTAKIPHRWEYVHDEVGYNYRLPNLNAALGCAQMERLAEKLSRKRAIEDCYRAFFEQAPWLDHGYRLAQERSNTRANYWINALNCPDRPTRDELLALTNDDGIQTRPVWELVYHMEPYAQSVVEPCPIAEKARDTVLNLPSWPYTT